MYAIRKLSMIIFILVEFKCFLSYTDFYAPAMIMAGVLSVTPVRPSVHTYVLTNILCPDDVRSLN